MSKDKKVKVLAEFGPAQYHVEEEDDTAGSWVFLGAFDFPIDADEFAQRMANQDGRKYRVVDTGVTQ